MLQSSECRAEKHALIGAVWNREGLDVSSFTSLMQGSTLLSNIFDWFCESHCSESYYYHVSAIWNSIRSCDLRRILECETQGIARQLDTKPASLPAGVR